MLGGGAQKFAECLCAVLTRDPIGIAKCICPKIDPEGAPAQAQPGGAVWVGTSPVSYPASGGDCTPGTVVAGGGAIGIDAPKVVPRPTPQNATAKDSGGGICAHVRIQLNQDLALTRQAFKGTLVVNNRTDTTPLTGVAVRVDFFDTNHVVVNERFAYAVPTLSGITAVDGAGTFAPNASGTVEYTFIPTTNAAPDGPTAYSAGGELRYIEGTNAVVITLNPAPITVLPQASLKVDYFHQRDVFSDDPFTPEIEPSIPYSLGVMLQNRGRGAAHAVKITSAQPKIIDSDKGLLVDFQIVATEVAGVGLTPSLTAQFGDINPGGIAIGRWLLKSSLQGLFIDYAATFEHINGLGRPDLSLIESVDIPR